ncbi:HprK-related kinase A [Sphingomonas solaris]|uniref:HprK-related kinase A n=1 Tax=Alterirhizorhabdus solaris TaxID=2529389 RepID=A0A558R0U7_9SPHN|nr:HprK-related kinase A [Sphingomonas solaris]TVV73001.1 HprK-related kinase A [Sphingomonas solaris]
MRHAFSVRIGPVGFRVGSAWPQPIAAMRRLYAGYPPPRDGIADFTVRLEPTRPWRRWLRPSAMVRGDFTLPDAAPLPLAQGLLAAEMGMNLQMALGARRWLLLHASCVERDGRALLMSGHSGAGKSTLSALLGERGWRLLGDEFALLDPASGVIHPFPRPVSLKNEAIAVMAAEVAADRLGPLIPGTPKGDIRHLRPAADALARMDEPATPAMLLFPRFGASADVRPMGAIETFVRLTQASTNYVVLGEAGFAALTGLVRGVPAMAIDYPDTAAAIDLVERLWAETAR